jgi:hypothetical protein
MKHPHIPPERPETLMSTKPKPEDDRGEDPTLRQAREASIRGRVILGLGSPADLVGVDVRPLWGDCYRVNVRVGEDFARSRVAHSYLLVADGDGNVLRSSPEIGRLH